MASIFVYPVLRAHSKRILDRMRGYRRPHEERPAGVLAAAMTAPPSTTSVAQLIVNPVAPTPSGWLPRSTAPVNPGLPFSVCGAVCSDFLLACQLTEPVDVPPIPPYDIIGYCRCPVRLMGSCRCTRIGSTAARKN
jgi:hypothetical protein